MITIREPTLQDEENFLLAMQKSVPLHHPWVKAPLTSEEFHTYIKRSQQDNQKSLIVLKDNQIAGVFNISEIVRGCFQNAFLGFYAVTGFENQGIMSTGLKLVLKYFFEELKLHRIEANIQPQNKRSIELIKKNGFRYEGQSPNYLKINGTWCTHEHWAMTIEDYTKSYIGNDKRKIQIDFTKIRIIPASLQDYSIIQNMGRFYVYDMSEFLGFDLGWEIPENGLYECIDFKKYWETNDAFPFLIRYENELAGFVIIDKKGSDASINFNVAQFFVLKKFQNKCLGRYIAIKCFKKFKGTWEVMVIPGNNGAENFWRSTIRSYTKNNFTEYQRSVKHFNNSIKNIFKFTNLDNNE